MAKEPAQHTRKPIGAQHGTPKPRKHRASDKRRGSARERGYSAAWDKFSRAFRQLNPLCEYCQAKGRTQPATVTDHDLPHEGDTELFWDNTFTALCSPCHNGPKASAEARLTGDALLAWVAKQKVGVAT